MRSLFLACLVLITLSLGIAAGEDPADDQTLWTYIVDADDVYDTVYDTSSEDSLLEIELEPGEGGHVQVWVVAHQHIHENPQIYMAVTPLTGFPSTEAQMTYFEKDGSDNWEEKTFDSTPRALDFDLNTGEDSIPFPTHGIWGSDTDYDVFPDADEPDPDFEIGNSNPGVDWDLDPEDPGNSPYDRDDLVAYAGGREGNYTVIDLWFTGSVLGEYIMHIDSYGPCSTGPDHNPFSHDATLIINIVPVLPVAAGTTTVLTCLGVLAWRRRA